MKAKKFLALLLALVLVLSLAACNNSSNNETSKDPSSETSNGVDPDFQESMEVDTERAVSNNTDRYDSILIAVANEVNNLQPYSQSDAGILPIMYEIYECLFDLKAGTPNVLENRLAKGYEDVDDTHCVVELYDYIKDSEGNTITASDVVFSFNLYLNSGFAQGEILDYYESSEALDDTHVQFTWTKPVTSLTAYGNIFAATYIVSEKAYNEHDFANDAIGTGPYKVKEYVTGAYTILEANDDYWQTDDLASPKAGRNVQEIRYDIVADSSMRLIALENGTASYCQLDDTSLPDFTTGGKYEGQYTLYTSYATTNQDILPNLSEESIMSNKDFRLAVYYAVDTEAMAIAMGSAYSACTENMSPIVPGYQESWNEARDDYYFVYDPDLAKEYLEKSGYNGEPVKIMAGTFALKKSQAEMVDNYLKEIGINSELEILENAVLQERYSDPTAWDMTIYSGGSASSIAIALNNQFGTAYGKVSGLNMSLICDQTLEDMIQNLLTADGYTDENIDATMTYIRDNAYAFGTLNNVYYYAFDPCYATLFWNNTGNILMPGACTYYLD